MLFEDLACYAQPFSGCENYVLALVCQLPATSYQPGSHNLAEPCLSQSFKGNICNGNMQCKMCNLIAIAAASSNTDESDFLGLDGVFIFIFQEPQTGVRPRSASLPQTNGRTTKRPSSARKAATLIETVSLAPRRPLLSRRFGRAPIWIRLFARFLHSTRGSA